jgi:fido (protein-threonine AMPylation protein)
MHGGNAARAAEVPRLFERWVSQVSEEMLGNEDLFIKSLLDIHPWADGNGRTASILRNWMFGNLKDPEPLPYYYGLGGVSL